MFPPPTGLVKVQYLNSRPDQAELHQLAEAARKDGQTEYDYVWSQDNENRKFMLGIKQSPGDPGILRWTLFIDAEPEAKRLWSQDNNDVLQIHAMILNASAAISLSHQRVEEDSDWQSQCRTFDGAEGLPIITLDRLYEVENKMEDSALNGELSIVGIISVLNSISMANLSGRLSIDGKQKRADVFFVDGTPVHATSTMGDGMECMLRLVALEEGQFYFDPRVKTEQRTVNQSLDSIILQGAKLADNTRFLKESGLSSDSILIRINLSLTETEFEKMVRQGEPVDMNSIKTTYLAVDGKSTLKEIMRKVGLSRTQWVPVIANLVRCKLVLIYKLPVVKKVCVAPKSIDPEILASLGQGFTDEHSGFYSYPAVLFMLERESYRADDDHPLSVVIFALGTEDKPIRNRILATVIDAKRRGDLLGHYEKDEFALIMPDTQSAKAAELIGKVSQKILLKSAITQMANSSSIISFGCGSSATTTESCGFQRW